MFERRSAEGENATSLKERRRQIERRTYLLHKVPPLLSDFPSREYTIRRCKEHRVVRGTSDGEGVVEEGEAELSEPFGEKEEERRSVEMEGIREGSELGSSKEGVLENPLEDFDGKICAKKER